MNTVTFVSSFILLFLIVDPIGNIPIFSSALKHVPKQDHMRIIVREHAFALLLLFAFLFFGQAFMSAVGLSRASLQISGAVILFLIAIKMVFPPVQHAPTVESKPIIPFIVPLAIPAVAGTSSMATVMLLVSQTPQAMVTLCYTLVAVITASCVILLAANALSQKLGERFLLATEKLMGLILVALSIEMLIGGLRALMPTVFAPMS